MATAIEYVRAALKDFRERNERDPETVEDYREIKDAAKQLSYDDRVPEFMMMELECPDDQEVWN